MLIFLNLWFTLIVCLLNNKCLTIIWFCCLTSCCSLVFKFSSSLLKHVLWPPISPHKNSPVSQVSPAPLTSHQKNKKAFATPTNRLTEHSATTLLKSIKPINSTPMTFTSVSNFQITLLLTPWMMSGCVHNLSWFLSATRNGNLRSVVALSLSSTNPLTQQWLRKSGSHKQWSTTELWAWL